MIMLYVKEKILHYIDMQNQLWLYQEQVTYIDITVIHRTTRNRLYGTANNIPGYFFRMTGRFLSL